MAETKTVNIEISKWATGSGSKTLSGDFLLYEDGRIIDRKNASATATASTSAILSATITQIKVDGDKAYLSLNGNTYNTSITCNIPNTKVISFTVSLSKSVSVTYKATAMLQKDFYSEKREYVREETGYVPIFSYITKTIDLKQYFSFGVKLKLATTSSTINDYTAYLYDGAFKKIKEAHLANSSGTLTKLK